MTIHGEIDWIIFLTDAVVTNIINILCTIKMKPIDSSNDQNEVKQSISYKNYKLQLKVSYYVITADKQKVF